MNLRAQVRLLAISRTASTSDGRFLRSDTTSRPTVLVHDFKVRLPYILDAFKSGLGKYLQETLRLISSVAAFLAEACRVTMMPSGSVLSPCA